MDISLRSPILLTFFGERGFKINFHDQISNYKFVNKPKK